MPSCVICGLEPQKRAEIERDLANGRSLRSIAAECNCDKESVRRHLQNHVSEKVARVANQLAEREGLNVINALVEQYEVVQRFLKQAIEGGKVTEVALMLKEGRKHLELSARLSGELYGSSTNVNVLLQPRFTWLKDTIINTLDPVERAKLSIKLEELAETIDE
jgi:hypothetical protein